MQNLVIASILKPVNDTRMYEKLGISLSKLNGFRINIAGFQGKIPEDPNVHFYPLFNFKRLSILKRLNAPMKFLNLLRKLKPAVVIISTHELLWPALFYSFFTKSKIIYDVRENYYLNIRYGDGFYVPFRMLLALYVRLKEKIFAPGISWFLLAESVYKEQLSFVKNKYSILPNSSVFQNPKEVNREPHKVVFTGTLAIETGVFEAIDFIKSLHAADDRYKLSISGSSPRKWVLEKISQESKDFPFIELDINDSPIPHEAIISQIESATFGFIHYHLLPYNKGKVPTKLYEYLGAGLIPLIYKNKGLFNMCPDHSIYLDEIETPSFDKESASPVIAQNQPFPLFWSHYEKELLAVFDNITKSRN